MAADLPDVHGCTPVNKSPIQPTLNVTYSKIHQQYLKVLIHSQQKHKHAVTSELQFSFLFFIWVVRGPPSYGRRKKEEKKRYKGDYFKTQKQPSWERGPITLVNKI